MGKNIKKEIDMDFMSAFNGTLAISIFNGSGTAFIYQERGTLVPDTPWSEPLVSITVNNAPRGLSRGFVEALESLIEATATVLDTVTYIWENTPDNKYKEELVDSYADIRSEFIPAVED